MWSPCNNWPHGHYGHIVIEREQASAWGEWVTQVREQERKREREGPHCLVRLIGLYGPSLPPLPTNNLVPEGGSG